MSTPDNWDKLPTAEKQRRTKLAESLVTREEKQAIKRGKETGLPTAETVLVFAGGSFWPNKLRQIAADAELLAAAIERSQHICAYGHAPGEEPLPAPVAASVAFSG